MSKVIFYGSTISEELEENFTKRYCPYKCPLILKTSSPLYLSINTYGFQLTHHLPSGYSLFSFYFLKSQDNSLFQTVQTTIF